MNGCNTRLLYCMKGARTPPLLYCRKFLHTDGAPSVLSTIGSVAVGQPEKGVAGGGAAPGAAPRVWAQLQIRRDRALQVSRTLGQNASARNQRRFSSTQPCSNSPPHTHTQTCIHPRNRVTTFLLATEDPRGGCRLTSAVLGAPPRTPACYEKGVSAAQSGIQPRSLGPVFVPGSRDVVVLHTTAVQQAHMTLQRALLTRTCLTVDAYTHMTHTQMDLKFPPEGDAAAAEAHVISSLQAPMGHMVLASVSCLCSWPPHWAGVTRC